MLTRPFRFVHAGEFHLEQPLMGVAEVPDHLRDLFIDAPYAAAGRVFDAVLAEDADFVLLAGDLLQPSLAGPRGSLFLVEQFARLAERGIDVYWAAGAADSREAWPTAVTLPQNVHVFPVGRVEEITILRDDEPLARLSGTSRERQRTLRPADFSADPTGLYSIAVAHGEAESAALQSRAIHYWALGGRHDRSTPVNGPQMVHYCGSPQGRRPEECGIHGCTLVQVNEQLQARTSLIPTDAVRWLSERVAIDETTSREDLETRLRDRVHAISEMVSPLLLGEGPGVRAASRSAGSISDLQTARPHPNPLPAGEGTGRAMPLLLSWTIAGQGPLMSQLRRGQLGAELREWLRNEYGYGSPAVWTVSLDVEISETLPPEWYEQETIRGDFLRAVRQLQMNPGDPLDLDAYLAESHLAGTLGAAVAFSGKAARDRALREAAMLGVDLLSGEEAHQ
jgi:DNA repair protein SbcD/Mre11